MFAHLWFSRGPGSLQRRQIRKSKQTLRSRSYLAALLRLRSPLSQRGARSLHVQVLLGVLDVPLDLSVYVEVKLLGHWQRDQRRSLWVRFLTDVKKTHNYVNI